MHKHFWALKYDNEDMALQCWYTGFVHFKSWNKILWLQVLDNVTFATVQLFQCTSPTRPFMQCTWMTCEVPLTQEVIYYLHQQLSRDLHSFCPLPVNNFHKPRMVNIVDRLFWRVYAASQRSAKFSFALERGQVFRQSLTTEATSCRSS